ncbi:DNA mismatch repair endonuclease MutL [Tianweitania sp. BSSL-BM11]|uniref:DNA mismatch repair protein MutL n=1 Tax=Tianweitania aestuarii TaxID=2814886 RepID=A0ABS5RRA2_9HYPH|nr:DNA mismatch repair endonuclease MutL [Tianweitania aestuarii]MBS9719509.1 DNA mismatch repair endonuclease MutL [Tianweitania aestuarii]
MPIRQLSDSVINQIAAGEVIERPASVVKELVENALDAGASRIEVATAGGGLTMLRVSDDGCGMSPDELPLAIGRHCTSKLSDDIFDIRSLGFRGEALPSIGSVSRLSIRSRTRDGEAAEIRIEGGALHPVRPAAGNQGTVVEVRDLFFATPARLKFMKSERAETAAITDLVKRIAIAFPHVRFTLSGSDRTTLDLPAHVGPDARLARIADVLGAEFADNALPIEAGREGVQLAGHISIPAYSRANALQAHVYVNGRPVRDKMLGGAIRGAYADVLSRDRYPVTALFLMLDPTQVDVNVHPAKADVRFRDPGLVRGLLVGAIRQTLALSGVRAATSGADAMLQAFRPGNPSAPQPASQPAAPFSYAASPSRPLDFGFRESARSDYVTAEPASTPEPLDVATDQQTLGAARAQVHENYIVAQTADSLIIVDQHAAHERLVYEALKTALHDRPLPTQMLLLPEIVDLPEDDAARLQTHADTLARLGLVLERFGPGAVAVRETPSMLGEVDVPALIRDLADEIADNDTTDALTRRLHAIASRMACHGSVRSGRRLRAEEMNALLRQMEATPGSGTCNHGRPTYIELKLHDIERLFGRR